MSSGSQEDKARCLKMSASFDLSKIKLAKLSSIYNLEQFDCGDADLNDFIKNDALTYEEQRVASTFLIIYDEKTLAGFFSLVNDSIRLKDGEEEGIDHSIPEYPSTKIARLAVQKELQKKGLGTSMVSIAIGWILECSHGASRFVTVDSYPQNVKWYEKIGFVLNLHSKYARKDDFISMRYDLLNPQKAGKK